jgi:Copper transport outer membrane protein, MctB
VINFRYHVVSLTAVFLALAIGLVVGTAALNGPLADSLKDQVNSLKKQNQQYRDQVTQLEAGAGRQEQFATDAAPILLQDKLAGRRVLVLSMPQASQYVDDVVKLLGMAGAKVTGRVEVEDRFTDPAQNETLLDLAGTSVPVGLTNVPVNSDGVETASFVLASALVDHNPPLPTDSLRSVLTSFKEANFVAVTGQPTGTAEAVVLLSGPPYTDPKADTRNKNVVTMVGQFARVGAEVVAANGAAGANNAISAVRGDPALQKTVSTVDNLATPQGRVAVVLAVNEKLVLNRAGAYGLAGGATAMLPRLAPS